MSRRTATVLSAAAVTAALAATAFVLLTVYAGTRPSPPRVDIDVQSALIDHRTHVLTALARTVTFLASTPELYAALVLAVLVGWRRQSVRLPIGCLLWFAAGQLLRTTINQVIARPRPGSDLRLTGAAGYAFPSGHTASATLAYGLAAVLVATYARRRRTVVITVVAAVVGAGGVGLSRVYLGVHWPTDVAGGWALGLCWLSIGVVLLQLSAVTNPRAAAPPPAAP